MEILEVDYMSIWEEQGKIFKEMKKIQDWESSTSTKNDGIDEWSICRAQVNKE